MAIISLPLLIYGQVKESGTGVDSITVKCRNNTTNQRLTATTDSNGLFLFDLSNMSSGWANGQQITIYTIYKDFGGQETVTIALPLYGYQQDIALEAVSDSELIDYCSVQDVYDELDGKTSSEISAERVVNAIQRAEGLIDTKTGTSFKAITVEDEVHSADRYSVELSPDQLDQGISTTMVRRDNWGNIYNNRVKTNFAPVVSITSLSHNQAGSNDADSWTELTEQTGSSGGYVLENADAGIIDFLTIFPRIGKRSWKITYVYGYDPDSTDRRVISILRSIERLTILLAAKAIITTKATGSMFDSTGSTTIGRVSISAGSMSVSQYLRSIDPEIEELWANLGSLRIEVI